MKTFDLAKYCELSEESRPDAPAVVRRALIILEFRDARLILVGRCGG